MPECDAKGVKGEWKPPSLEIEMDWASNLTEVASRKEADLIWATKEEELAYNASKVEEATRIKPAGDSGTATAESDDEEDPTRNLPRTSMRSPLGMTPHVLRLPGTSFLGPR